LKLCYCFHLTETIADKKKKKKKKKLLKFKITNWSYVKHERMWLSIVEGEMSSSGQGLRNSAYIGLHPTTKIRDPGLTWP
jgi:hypothetical protein